MRDAADLAGLTNAETDEVVLAVNEACMNIIQHSYAMDPDGRIEIRVGEQPGALVVQLRDYAACVDTGKVCSRDLDDIRPGGLGMHLIGCLMDEHGFLDPPPGGGNLYQMIKLVKR